VTKVSRRFTQPLQTNVGKAL